MKLLIVEDEKYEREALEQLVQKSFKTEIDVCMSTNNGASALQLFEEYKFDIVISDINIPKLNGLELLKIIKEHCPMTLVLILTSYNYFEYALESIHIGVEDFILKPSTATKKEDSIRHAIQKHKQLLPLPINNTTVVNNLKEVVEKNLVYSILCNEDSTFIQSQLQLFDFQAVNGICFAIRTQDKKNEILQVFHSVCEHKDSLLFSDYFYHFYIVFLLTDHLIDDSKIHTIYDSLLLHNFLAKDIGISSIKKDIDKFNEASMEAISIVAKKAANQILQDDITDANLSVINLAQNFVIGLHARDYMIYKTTSVAFVNLLMHIGQQEYCALSNIFFTAIQDRLKSYCDTQKANELIMDSLNWIERGLTLKEIRVFISFRLNCIMDVVYEDKNKNTNKLIITALQFIETNYAKPIGLLDLAKLMNLTPQYVSSLFKQYTDSTFINTLLEYRINKARELLKEGVQIKEVANMVGFQNQNYFARTFKKITGFTASEYKARSC